MVRILLLLVLLSISVAVLGDERKIDIVGVWDQHIYYYKNGEYAYHYVGSFEVFHSEDKYQMRQVRKQNSPELIHPAKISKVAFDGKTWTFYSDWREYGIGFFKLSPSDPKDPNLFEGYSYSTDEEGKPVRRLSPNRWIRLGL